MAGVPIEAGEPRPADELVGSVEAADPAEVDATVARARIALRAWASTKASVRAARPSAPALTGSPPSSTSSRS